MLAKRYTYKIPDEYRSSRRHGVVEQDLRARTGGKVLVQHILQRQVREIRSRSTRVPQVRWWRGGGGGFMHVDDILAHAQATIERFAAELGEKFKVKSMVEKFGVEKARRTSASSGVPILSPSGLAANSGGRGRCVEVPYQEAVGALMWMATMTRPDIACAVPAVIRFWNPGLAHY